MFLKLIPGVMYVVLLATLAGVGALVGWRWGLM